MGFISVLNYVDDNPDAENFICRLPRERMSDEAKDMVLNYLNNADFRFLSSWHMPSTDPFNGKHMWDKGILFHDKSKFCWTDKLSLYVRDHDVKLPDDFIQHVLAFYADGGTVRPEYDWKTERLGECVFDGVPLHKGIANMPK